MEKLQQIVHELAFGSRKSQIRLIQELASDEYETAYSVFILAEKSKKQIKVVLSYLFDYYSKEVERELKRYEILDSYYESFSKDTQTDIDNEFKAQGL